MRAALLCNAMLEQDHGHMTRVIALALVIMQGVCVACDSGRGASGGRCSTRCILNHTATHQNRGIVFSCIAWELPQ